VSACRSLEGATVGRSCVRTTLLMTTSALAMMIALEGSAAAQCAFQNNNGIAGTLTNSTPASCVTYFDGTNHTVNVVNNSSLTAPGTYPPIFPGTATGISVLRSGTTLSGNIVNNGSISAENAGINIGQGTTKSQIQLNAGAVVNGSITNSGTITATDGIFVSGNSSLLSTLTGSIINAGGVIQGADAAINVQNATVGGSITNAGTITSTGSSAINVFDSNLGSTGAPGSGNIVNAAGAHITGSANGFAAIVVNGSVGPITTIAGSIINNGTISAFQLGVEVIEATALGGVTNGGSGTIDAAVGISLTGTSHAPVSIGGNIVNQGTINAAAVPAFFSGGFSEGIAIFGGSASTAALVGGAAGISNSGTISATGGKTSNVGIVLASAHLVGGITNSGAIFASGGARNVGIYVTSSSVNSVKSSIGGSIVNKGSITAGTGIIVGGQSTIAGSISNTAGGTISATKTGIVVTGGAVVTGGITNSGNLSGGVNAINLTGEGAPTTINVLGGVISGNMVGGGADAVNFGLGSPGTFAYSGAISAVSAVNVNSGFTLYDNGSISAGAVTVMDGGTLAPGAPGTPGHLNITGSLVFQSAGTYMVQLTPATASQTTVNGTATLSGTVNAVFLPGTYLTKQYDILHVTGGGVGGTNEFTLLTTTGKPANVTADLNYGSNDVFLNLTVQLGGGGGGLNQNQQSVANAINTFFNNGGALPPGFASILNLSGTNLANALTQLDGENATGAEHSAFVLMNEFLDLMLDPYVYGRGGYSSGGQPLGFAPAQPDSLPPDIARAYAGVLKAPPQQTFEQRWTAWGSAFGGSGTTNGDPTVGSNNVTTSTYGYAAGMDYHYSPDTVFGFSLAGGGTNWNLAQGLGTGRSDAFLAGIYGVTHQGPVYLAGSLAFASNWFTTNRTALGDALTANFQGQSYAGRLEGGYRFAIPISRNAIGITPYVAIQAQNFHTPAYSETDLTAGGFGLSYAAMNGTDTRSELGARFDDPTLLGNMPLILRVRAAWAHDWVSNSALNASFESLPGTSFTVNGAPTPHDATLTSAGAQLFFTANWSLLAKFDGEFAAGSQTYAGTGTLRYTW
jgi:uncharacterized protein with beta-barrel porin domain